MKDFGAKAYERVDVDSGVSGADPHGLVLMLFDGVLEAIRLAQAHIAAGQVADKGHAIGKAVRIIEEGLKASLDRNAGGPLARQLAALYDYASLRLLQAHIRNDDKALDEIARLLADLRQAWSQIGGRAPAAAPKPSQQPASVPLSNANAKALPGMHFPDGASTAPIRRVIVAA
jgi:flagellar protein FliS